MEKRKPGEHTDHYGLVDQQDERNISPEELSGLQAPLKSLTQMDPDPRNAFPGSKNTLCIDELLK